MGMGAIRRGRGGSFCLGLAQLDSGSGGRAGDMGTAAAQPPPAVRKGYGHGPADGGTRAAPGLGDSQVGVAIWSYPECVATYFGDAFCVHVLSSYLSTYSPLGTTFQSYNALSALVKFSHFIANQGQPRGARRRGLPPRDRPRQYAGAPPEAMRRRDEASAGVKAPTATGQCLRRSAIDGSLCVGRHLDGSSIWYRWSGE
jgi:hypothetical protein